MSCVRPVLRRCHRDQGFARGNARDQRTAVGVMGVVEYGRTQSGGSAAVAPSRPDREAHPDRVAHQASRRSLLPPAAGYSSCSCRVAPARRCSCRGRRARSSVPGTRRGHCVHPPPRDTTRPGQIPKASTTTRITPVVAVHTTANPTPIVSLATMATRRDGSSAVQLGATPSQGDLVVARLQPEQQGVHLVEAVSYDPVYLDRVASRVAVQAASRDGDPAPRSADSGLRRSRLRCRSARPQPRVRHPGVGRAVGGHPEEVEPMAADGKIEVDDTRWDQGRNGSPSSTWS